MHLPELDWYCFNIDGSLTSEAPMLNLAAAWNRGSMPILTRALGGSAQQSSNGSKIRQELLGARLI
jgi:hypothetical protein